MTDLDFSGPAMVIEPTEEAAERMPPVPETLTPADGHIGTTALDAAMPFAPSGGHPEAGGGDQNASTAHEAARDRAPSAACPDAIATLVHLGWLRSFVLTQRQRADLAAQALLRRMVGWTPDADEKTREKHRKQAAQAWKALRAGDAEFDDLPEAAVDTLQVFAASVSQLDEQLKQVEKRMEKVAKTLPGAAFIASVRGVSPKGLAILVAEAGDIGAYTRDGLWKRLGLAPYDGAAMATWRTGKPRKLTAEEWIDAGYSGRRRSSVYAYVEDPLFRGQWGGPERGALGPYGEIYATVKARAADQHPDWTKARLHQHARRVMVKTFIRDLRKAWRADERGCNELG